LTIFRRDCLPVIVNIKTKPLLLEEKLKLFDKLCGSWKDDGSLEAIFAEIERQRHEDKPREAIQPEARKILSG